MTMKEIFKKTKDSVSNAASSTGEFVSDVASSTGDAIGNMADSTAEAYNESSIKKGVDYVSDGTSNQLDVISGQKMYDLVQERIELQNNVNDVLAHKLHEALNCIEKLEEEIKTLKS